MLELELYIVNITSSLMFYESVWPHRPCLVKKLHSKKLRFQSSDQLSCAPDYKNPSFCFHNQCFLPEPQRRGCCSSLSPHVGLLPGQSASSKPSWFGWLRPLEPKGVFGESVKPTSDVARSLNFVQRAQGESWLSVWAHLYISISWTWRTRTANSMSNVKTARFR